MSDIEKTLLEALLEFYDANSEEITYEEDENGNEVIFLDTLENGPNITSNGEVFRKEECLSLIRVIVAKSWHNPLKGNAWVGYPTTKISFKRDNGQDIEFQPLLINPSLVPSDGLLIEFSLLLENYDGEKVRDVKEGEPEIPLLDLCVYLQKSLIDTNENNVRFFEEFGEDESFEAQYRIYQRFALMLMLYAAIPRKDYRNLDENATLRTMFNKFRRLDWVNTENFVSDEMHENDQINFILGEDKGNKTYQAMDKGFEEMIYSVHDTVEEVFSKLTSLEMSKYVKRDFVIFRFIQGHLERSFQARWNYFGLDRAASLVRNEASHLDERQLWVFANEYGLGIECSELDMASWEGVDPLLIPPDAFYSQQLLDEESLKAQFKTGLWNGKMRDYLWQCHGFWDPEFEDENTEVWEKAMEAITFSEETRWMYEEQYMSWVVANPRLIKECLCGLFLLEPWLMTYGGSMLKMLSEDGALEEEPVTCVEHLWGKSVWSLFLSEEYLVGNEIPYEEFENGEDWWEHVQSGFEELKKQYPNFPIDISNYSVDGDRIILNSHFFIPKVAQDFLIKAAEQNTQILKYIDWRQVNFNSTHKPFLKKIYEISPLLFNELNELIQEEKLWVFDGDEIDEIDSFFFE